MENSSRIIWSTIISILFVAFLNYLCLPTLAWGFSGWMGIVFFVGIIYLLFSIGDDWNPCATIGTIICSLILFFWIVVGFFTNSAIIGSNAEKYQKLLGTVHEITNNRDLTATDINKIIFIDEEVAAKYGDKQISTAENLALGSQVTIGHYTQQIVAGKVYYVAPLLHGGFFKYLNNSETGTPGYVIVDAINPKNSKLVTKLDDGTEIRNVYQYEEAYFSKNLERHLRRNGYRTVGLADFSYELDDSFHPYWVVTKYNKTIGFTGNNATGVVIVDPKTGEIKDYDIKNLPEWVDRVQPKDFMTTQVTDWGELVHGFWNFSGKDKLKLTQDISMSYGNDGRCYFYAGLTSTGADNTSIGFLMINSRTKEVSFYKSKGTSEDKAASSAEGMVQQMHYKATHARFYNLNGDFTFAFGLKDAEGLVKKYAFVNYDDYAIVGIGDDENSAYRDYRSKLNGKGNEIVGDKFGNVQEVNGIVTRFSVDNKDGNSLYYLTVDKLKNKMFVTKSDINPKIILTKIGDNVKISYNDGSEGVIDISSFDNLSFNVEKSEALKEVEKDVQKSDSLIEQKKTKIEVEQLSEQDKVKLLKEKRSKK